jgi:hypothetical protein|tara:strand:- start:917 stop:1174 length:258 start_codon:yes stop_codon:yes gene_type:complete
MKKATRSLLEELTDLTKRDSSFDDHLIESKCNNLIIGCINILEKIGESYDPEVAADLQRKFLNSIKAGDPKKFKRSIERIIESKK